MKVATFVDRESERRVTLTRQRVLEAAIDLADHEGIDAVSMRRLGQELGVEAMSLYTHVKSKEDLLDGMAETVMDQVPTQTEGRDWKPSFRKAVLDARAVLLRHPWAPPILETRAAPGPATLRQYDTVMGILRQADFTLEQTHHAIHLMGSRLLGFTRELPEDPDLDPAIAAALAQQLAPTHPYVAEMAVGVTHEGGLGGCDTDAEFVFALDFILDGLERMKFSDTASADAG